MADLSLGSVYLRKIDLANAYMWIWTRIEDTPPIGPALSTRGNLAHARARARGAGSPGTVEHHYLPGLGLYETLMMRAKE